MHPWQIEGKYLEWLRVSKQDVVPCHEKAVSEEAVWVRPPTMGVKTGPGPASAAVRRCASVCAAHGLQGARGQLAEHELQS